MKTYLKYSMLAVAALLVVSLVVCGGLTTPASAATNITVSGTPWGQSICYSGLCEGSAHFDVDDLVDLGANTYRIWGGMSAWEPVDDDGVFGSPTIAEIKANPNVIDWSAWDSEMNAPHYYGWGGDPGYSWPGSAAQMLQALKDNDILPVITVRNVDNNDRPPWALTLNPPDSTDDWNEWWEHVFATVYWINVRNDYQVDHWQVHNEPSNSDQGWGGTLADYELFTQYTYDAIKYVYDNYLPGRTPHVLAPVATGDAKWTDEMLQDVPDYFTALDFHPYDDNWGNFTGRMQKVHDDIAQYGGGKDWPVWGSEWGTWEEYLYDGVPWSVDIVVENLILGSRPGDTHMDGGHVFALYDWAGNGWTYDASMIHGNPSTGGYTYTPGYYALRIANRGLQGCRTTYETTTDNSNVLAITTMDAGGLVSLLATNHGNGLEAVTADLSALLVSGTGTMYEFSAAHMDEVVGSVVLNNGIATFDLPADAAVLIQFTGGTPPPTPTPTLTPGPPTATPDISNNLALGKPTEVSSYQSTDQMGDKAVDANMTTYWRALKNSGLTHEWIQVDLGSTMSVSQVQLEWDKWYATEYTIQVSSNGTDWTTVATVTGADGGNDTMGFETTSARYVKMDSTAWNNSREHCYLSEFEVYGPAGPPPPTDTPAPPTDTPIPPTDTPVPSPTDTPEPGPTDTPAPPTDTPEPGPTDTPEPPPTDTPVPPPTNTPGSGSNLALGRPVEVSSNEENNPGPNAVDGDLGTIWRTVKLKRKDVRPDEWIKVDLGSSYAVSQVVLKWDSKYATSYEVQVSQNGSNWTSVYSTTSGDGGTDTINFAASASYVRLYTTVWSEEWEGNWLQEFEVYE